ncbi:calcium/sodium antiporter [bacterium]|jgi:cation:H+ antiporter|nr:calcium/sodium antiporter [bacterium]MBT4649351.1 calcium/sodium antiporter [bacterium]
MYITLSLFLVGFYFLIKGADWLVIGASSIAKRLRVSDLMIGLTVVSFGTSAPELIVNLIASFQGSADLAIGNIIGSNISNVLLILGIAAVIYPLAIKKGTIWKEIPFNLLAIVALWLLINDRLIDAGGLSLLSRIDGGILLLFFVIFLYYTFGISKVEGEGEDVKKHKTWMSILMVIAGMLALAFGGKWIVDGAIVIAQFFGMSERLIGLTIIAIGTSLPELAATAVAAWKHNSDIAIGNIIGSNVFNIFWILGLSSLVKPLFFNTTLNIDIYVMGIATVILFLFMFVGKKNILQRWQGVVMLGLYVAYIVYLALRG